MRMPNEMILVVGIVIVFIYILFSSTPGKKLNTFMLRLEQAGLNVVDFIPKGEGEFRGMELIYRGVPRIKLPIKREHLNLEEFISMAEKYEQDTIYRKQSPSPWGVLVHYVFNQDKSITWIYNVW